MKWPILVGVLALIIVVLGVAMVILPGKNTGTPGTSAGVVDTIAVGGTTKDLITLTTPVPGAKIQSPLTLTGQARGTWYFEASFPVTIEDANGRMIGQVAARAKSDWMTEDFVPFEATIEFYLPTTTTGTLILHKDNASGLPENDDELRVPIRFK